MTIKELRQLSKVELQRLLQEMRETLRELRFKTARRELKDVREVRDHKKTIARILTMLKEESVKK
ncbi:50S ribosomal protein L29 [Candidatus Uhrbacteria bacterium RIFCSPLOWO2_01_FULL_47_24]|uniref:Large ribosomal subunit protein uL29 n=1 Tax=Candidatus Uhrbacteria bacterium RIFCSPLOWO2_01_FULL_47_24 TaxID=1802401 RepID=A0A1F7UTM7_9BACT|nr:MAG: 50S ribosomal protein L29 [Candidatus Uhrbacteria bacterium RIFCSPHIGHO2_01_FULL_47_11]OGL68972.1 MAG: 50S ribosomal protein L29 [Candidatus Uhrbacteria bacterium RIFCSPHIGHO2_02_FULL_46_47]OGL74911.1 MAG: 50S ribosomal protein L29 [Candidatus Uhrbacteria bacterium RIFCSPHIGHO2_12_FULL_47_11]OGL81651.1 MAG: 50S ribosomal protein L29 [Candidatus Uhrbacteria bacterium RIFCSPLOWO2_01_FULL_47_24]OGL85096.1 MAG: 50S ribosomal protein L29 [Candidatus Uhrbacteria bacterium RIFCSPLOWO2_02_FULL_